MPPAAVSVRLVDRLDLGAALATLVHPGAGGTATFVGTVRDEHRGRAVRALDFEAYDAMAHKEMQIIADELVAEHGLLAATLWHVVGAGFAVGEPVVFCGAAHAHRGSAFAACRQLIDRLKASVPIWKHEHFTDGSEWVTQTP